MNLNAFKGELLAELKRRLGPSPDIHIEEASRDTSEGITIIPENMKGRPYPVVDIEAVYKDYKAHGCDIGHTACSVLDLFASLWQQAPECPYCAEENHPMPLRCIGCIGPIDWWNGAFEVEGARKAEVLALMPEAPRCEEVFLTYIPNPNRAEMQELYMCKADNNGTVYLFAQNDVIQESLEYYSPNI